MTGEPHDQPLAKADLERDPASAAALKRRIGAAAERLGFDRWGCAAAHERPRVAALAEWLARGEHAGMAYMARRTELRGDPGRLLPGCRTVLCVALNYSPPGLAGQSSEAPGRLRVARYAWGSDYHPLVRGKLHQLLQAIKRWVPGARGRVAVDSAPVLEREWAALAGLGWIGRNSCLIVPRLGSYVVLGELLLDVALPPDTPVPPRCGNCRRCLEACPTAALIAPFRLDARRCVSYWTVEHRGPFPPAGVPRLAPWLFGCDACQEACPWNRFATATREPAWQDSPGRRIADPGVLAGLSAARFAELFAGTALARAGFEGLERNRRRILEEGAPAGPGDRPAGGSVA
jgi:epoxyqueuosine reductase